MRIIVANCSVVYTGRGDTTLKKAIRAIMIKEDGAISIHSDAGNKPLNYMGKGNVFTIVEDKNEVLWHFDTTKENLTIKMFEIYSDTEHTLEENDEGLIRDGTEAHLQAWLAANPEVLGEGYTLVEREFNTGNGPVDLLVRDNRGQYVAVEVKRVAMLGAVGQVNRYVNALNEEPEFEGSTAIIAALDIRPNTQKLADKRGVTCISVKEAWQKYKEEQREQDHGETPEQVVESPIVG